MTVGTLHSVVPPGYLLLRAAHKFLATVLRQLDACITVSDTVVDSLGPSFPGQEFVTIPNGIDTPFFSPDAEPLPDLAGRPTMLFVGRFDPRNGVSHAIGAFKLLKPKHPDLQFVHAEVYTNAEAVKDLQAATLTPAVNAYGLTYEPSLYVADATGTIVDRLDYIFDATDLDASLSKAA